MHDLIQGDLAARTAVYPELLCLRFAKALLQKDTRLFSVFGNFHDDSKDRDVVFFGENEIGAEPSSNEGVNDGLPDLFGDEDDEPAHRPSCTCTGGR